MAGFGDLIGKAKDFAQKNPEKVQQAINTVEDKVDQATKGKFTSAVDKAGDAVEKQLGLPDQAAPTNAEGSQA